MIEIYREHIKRQEHHFRTDPDIQAKRQRKAVEAHLAQEAERISRLPEIAKESEPISQNPLVARPRLKLPPQKQSRASRAQQKEKNPNE